MMRWRLIEKVWCSWPSRPNGLVEVIGGSYLAATPHLTYRRLFEGLIEHNIAIHAWSYIPGFDHQIQANNAWKNLRYCRKKLEDRVGDIPKVIRLGHSLGVKLHLLSPDGGRNCNGLISLSFNNSTAKKSIPVIKELAPNLGIKAEFSPGPKDTISTIFTTYYQPNNLIISFSNDNLDESSSLIHILQKRKIDNSDKLILSGDHLTPTSISLVNNIIYKTRNINKKDMELKRLVDTICDWHKLRS